MFYVDSRVLTVEYVSESIVLGRLKFNRTENKNMYCSSKTFLETEKGKAIWDDVGRDYLVSMLWRQEFQKI